MLRVHPGPVRLRAVGGSSIEIDLTVDDLGGFAATCGGASVAVELAGASDPPRPPLRDPPPPD